MDTWTTSSVFQCVSPSPIHPSIPPRTWLNCLLGLSWDNFQGCGTTRPERWNVVIIDRINPKGVAFGWCSIQRSLRLIYFDMFDANFPQICCTTKRPWPFWRRMRENFDSSDKVAFIRRENVTFDFRCNKALNVLSPGTKT